MKKWYLPDGADLTADFAEVKFVNGVMCFDGWGECNYYYNGLEVEYDENGYYVESDVDPIT